MPDGIAGDQSPPSDRHGPTFRDIYSFVENVVRVGTRACDMPTEAVWLLDMSLVKERARSRKRSNGASGEEIEMMDRVIAAGELLGAIADAVLPENKGEGSTAIGEAQGHHNAPLHRRQTDAAKLRDLTSDSSGKHWHQQYGRPMTRGIAETLFRLIYAPDTVDDPFASEKGGTGK